MKEIAKYGRNGDTQIGHLTTGEIVVPKGIINLKLQKELQKAFEKQGTDIKRYTVGSSSNSINPITGQPEFFFKSVASRTNEKRYVESTAETLEN